MSARTVAIVLGTAISVLTGGGAQAAGLLVADTGD